MKKIRINELARELEVKPGAIIDLLAEFGVTEKKTHSSSIDEDVALAIAKRLTGSSHPLFAHLADARDTESSAVAVAEPPAPLSVPASPPAPAATPAKPAPAPPVRETGLERQAAPASLPAPAAAPAPKPQPVRPPLAGGQRAAPAHHAPSIPIPPVAAHHAPSIPIPPPAPRPAAAPVRPVLPKPPAPSVPPVHPAPAAPPAPAPPAPLAPGPVQKAPAPPPSASPQAVAPPIQAAPPRPAPPPPAAPAAPPVPRPTPGVAAPTPAPVPKAPEKPIPSIPMPPARAGAPPTPAPGQPLAKSQPLVAARPSGPKPGSILSGPRQPLPAGMGELRSPSVTAGPPRPSVSSRPVPPLPHPPSAPAGAGGSPARPPLAGQPAARPVVPPRPDLVAKLAQTTPRATPGQPMPRPGMPRPGQPLVPDRFRGPVRPGQPFVRPGQAPGGPGARPLRGRAGLVPPPVEAPPPTGDRRPGDRRARSQRVREMEEGNLKSFQRRSQETVLPVIERDISLSEGITVKELAEKLGVKAALVIKVLFGRKIYATINQTLDVKIAEEIAKAFGATTSKMTYEEESVQDLVTAEVAGVMERRPPVVTIMGHVDHGKTSLLDAIRETNVAAREAGGITQHIGAYYVDTGGRRIVFIDTPGHEAFTRMRARGAKVTDIVVLVVAADDGVMPQTREAIDHARAAKVPLIVAVNKIDKPDAQPERVKQQLTDLGLMPEEWGGDTIFVPVSARQKQNLDLMLEMILLVADMQELTANPLRPAVATVLEAKLDRGRGPVATILIRNGTLRVGDYYLCGSVFGRVRAMFDDRGNPLKEAGPAMPVEVLGFESLPEVGDNLQVVTDLDKAKQVVVYRETKAREAAMAKTRITLEQLHAQLREGERKELNLIIKADVGGTAEVLSDTLRKLSSDKVSIRVISTGVGAITESDVLLASASEAIIIGFNVRPERSATALADQEKVEIRLHTIIYELTDEIRKAMAGMLEPVIKETYQGRAEVRETFRISKVGTVAGCYVSDGFVKRDSQIRLLRDNIVVHTGRVDALKRFKNDASEVKNGFECGISIAGYNDIKPGDTIEAFMLEKIAAEV